MLRSGYEIMLYGAMCNLDVVSQLLLVLSSPLGKMMSGMLCNWNSQK